MNNSCETAVFNQCDLSVCTWNKENKKCERKECVDCKSFLKTDFCEKIKEIDTCYKYAICTMKDNKCVKNIY